MKTLAQAIGRKIPGMREVDADRVEFPGLGYIKVLKRRDGVPYYFEYDIHNSGASLGNDLQKIVGYFTPKKPAVGGEKAIQHIRDQMTGITASTDRTPDWKEYDRLNNKLTKIINTVNKHGKKKAN